VRRVPRRASARPFSAPALTGEKGGGKILKRRGKKEESIGDGLHAVLHCFNPCGQWSKPFPRPKKKTKGEKIMSRRKKEKKGKQMILAMCVGHLPLDRRCLKHANARREKGGEGKKIAQERKKGGHAGASACAIARLHEKAIAPARARSPQPEERGKKKTKMEKKKGEEGESTFKWRVRRSVFRSDVTCQWRVVKAL